MNSCVTCVVVVALAGGPAPATAQVGVGPRPALSAPSVEAPKDRPFKGTIALTVDATDVHHKIFDVHETIPVQTSGPLTLLYPRWETGSHAATAVVADLAGLRIRGGGTMLSWSRDPIDVYAFHVDVPKGVSAISVEFQYITRIADAVLMPDLIAVHWHRMLLYPAGWFARDIAIEARLIVPSGLRPFSSLDVDSEAAGVVVFKPTTLEALTDAPVYASRYSRQVDLDPGACAPVRLDIVTDDPTALEFEPGEVGTLRALVAQTRRLFGAIHYRHYDALVSLSDRLSPSGGGGIEHFESGENNLPASYFTDPMHHLNDRDLIAHEFVHSWNGRFRQPADLWAPTLNVPMRDDLLWVYEGQTEFWGRILAARSGLRTRQETLDKLALDAAVVESRRGRSWKSLADSNLDPLSMIGHPVLWRDWQRREDYYPEGVMLWLDVDALIREKTGGRRSLDDFARSFFGVNDGSVTTLTYTFEDVCSALKQIAPFDWTGFLHRWLEAHDGSGVLDGLAREGWRLVYTEERSETFRQDELESGVTNLSYSVGLAVADGGIVKSVSWMSPAFAVGLAPGDRIVSVNGKPYSPAALQDAVRSAATTLVQLSYEADGRRETVTVPYQGTLRYPHLERIAERPDSLGALLEPLGESLK